MIGMPVLRELEALDAVVLVGWRWLWQFEFMHVPYEGFRVQSLGLSAE